MQTNWKHSFLLRFLTQTELTGSNLSLNAETWQEGLQVHAFAKKRWLGYLLYELQLIHEHL